MSSVLVPLAGALLVMGSLWLAGVLLERRAASSASWEPHPALLGMAMGIYSTSWLIFGSAGAAERSGLAFLSMDMGAALSCLAIPLLWHRVATVVDRFGARSLADVLAVRFHSRLVGAVVAMFMLCAVLPYIALQLRAVAGTAQYLAGESAPGWLGTVYVLLITGLALLMGMRYIAPGRRHPGLLGAAALDAVWKVLALTVCGVLALVALGGPSGIQERLAAEPELARHLTEDAKSPLWIPLLLMGFFMVFMLPRQFHIAFVERPDKRSWRHLVWTLPLVLLLFDLFIPVIYLAGREFAAVGAAPDRLALEATSYGFVRLLMFMGGVSASSMMVVVATVAVSGMVVQHLLLPLRPLSESSWAYANRMRQLAIAGLVLVAALIHLLLEGQARLVDLGLVSFSLVLQFVPGLLATVFWPRATRAGFYAGLGAGFAVWFSGVLAPLLQSGDVLRGDMLWTSLSLDGRGHSFMVALVVNALVMAVVSLLGPQRGEERDAALVCAASPGEPVSGPWISPTELRRRLSRTFSRRSADLLVDDALGALGLANDESRAFELMSLRQLLLRQLSREFGPIAARELLAPRPLARGDTDPGGLAGGGPDSRIAAELRLVDLVDDGAASTLPARVRRYVRAVVHSLPIGVCTLDSGWRIVLWNDAISTLSGVSSREVVGAPVEQLPAHWEVFLSEALRQPFGAVLPRSIMLPDGTTRLLEARCTTDGGDGRIIIVSDRSEEERLRRQVAHQERLAAVGRLAAGVAHEIGNPLAGLLLVAGGLREDASDDDTRGRAATIEHEGRRIEGIIRTLLTFSRSGEMPAGAGDACHVMSMVDDALRVVKLARAARNRVWEVLVDEELEVRGDFQRLTQVVVNLVANAVDASEDGTRITVAAWSEGDRVVIEVSDEGTGISPDAEPRLFEPFFTTRPTGEGTGLGLTVSYWIVQEHEGTLSWRNREAGGAAFRVELPMHVAADPPTQHQNPS